MNEKLKYNENIKWLQLLIRVSRQTWKKLENVPQAEIFRILQGPQNSVICDKKKQSEICVSNVGVA